MVSIGRATLLFLWWFSRQVHSFTPHAFRIRDSPSSAPPHQASSYKLFVSLDNSISQTTASYQEEQQAEAESNCKALTEWLMSEKGAWIHPGITVSTIDGLRGLFTHKHIKAGDLLLSVPLSVCFGTAIRDDSSSVISDDIGIRAPSWTSRLPNKVQLAILLLLEQSSSKNDWTPFLQSWPDDISGIPETIPDDVLIKEAQCQKLIEDTRRHRSWVQEQYQTVLQCSQFSDISFESFATALRLVASRSIRLSSQTSILVPLLDMANHGCSNPSANYRLHQDEEIHLVAAHDLQPNDPVTISYGDYCNRQLAGCYGFVPKQNPSDYESMSLSEVLCAAKIHDAGILAGWDDANIVDAIQYVEEELGFETQNFKLYASGPEEDLWLAVRAAISDNREELSEVLDAIDMDEADEEDLWDMESDEEVVFRVKVVQAAVEELLKRFTTVTSIEQDEHRLRSNDNSDGLQLLVKLRLERKRLLETVSNNMKIALDHPENKMRDFLSQVCY